MASLCLGGNSTAWADHDFVAKILRNQPPKSIAALQFASDSIVLSPRLENGKYVLKGTLVGALPGKGLSLVVGVTTIKLSSEGGFRIPLRLSAPSSSFVFKAVDARGAVQEEKIGISIGPEEWKQSIQAYTENRQTPRLSRQFGVGVTSLSYQQTGFLDFTSIAITPKVTVQYWLVPKRWDLGFTGFLTLLPVSSNQAVTLRFLGLNLRGGYHPTWLSDPWGISLMGGTYFTTTVMSSAPFGYQNLGGLQFFPMIRRTFANRSLIGGYFKLSPIASGFGFRSLSDRELGAGLFYQFPPVAGANAGDSSPSSLSLSLDLADLVLSGDASEVRTRSVTLGLGYRW